MAITRKCKTCNCYKSCNRLVFNTTVINALFGPNGEIVDFGLIDESRTIGFTAQEYTDDFFDVNDFGRMVVCEDNVDIYDTGIISWGSAFNSGTVVSNPLPLISGTMGLGLITIDMNTMGQNRQKASLTLIIKFTPCNQDMFCGTTKELTLTHTVV